MGKTAKLDKLGLVAKEDVMQWKGEGLSDNDIVTRLKEKYNLDIHTTNVGRFVKRHLYMIGSMTKGENRVRDQAIQEWEKLRGDMLKIRDELWTIVDALKMKGDVKEIRTTLSELSRHIERMNSLLGHMIDVNYEQVDITTISSRIPEILQSLQAQGYIEIKKKLPEKP